MVGQRMPPSHEPSATPEGADLALSLAARFRQRYEQTARFREDRALAEELTELAAPLLSALAELGPQPDTSATLHDAYALLSALSRAAALRDATASVAVTLIDAIVWALRGASLVLDDAQRLALSIVATEAFCAAHEEHASRALRTDAAESQVMLKLGPRCCAIVLAGRHDEPELGPVLDRFARELLHDDARACLLELSRLRAVDQELARALGRFCLHATTLGVRLALVGVEPTLRSALVDWGLTSPLISFFDDYDRAQRATLAAAGLEVRFFRRWARLFFPARSGLVR
jgi:anti-anti-sigma regulatory factor